MKVSIIIAVYNIENYIDKCLESIINQTFQDFECIVVDDGSIDNSSSICDHYSQKDERIKVIHKKNQGLPLARKTGFENSSGEYLLFIDGDDWLETDMVNQLVVTMQNENSDIVICDFFRSYEKRDDIISYAFPKRKEEKMYSFIKKPNYMNFFWNKLIKRSLFDKEYISFPEGISMCEDLFVTFKLFYFAEKISQVKKPLYHYRQNNVSAMTKNFTKEAYKSKMKVLDNLIAFLENENVIDEYSEIVNFYKIYNRLPLIIIPGLRNKILWASTYPESNKYIWQVPLRLDYKILSWLCKIGLFRVAYFMQDIKKKTI